MKVSREEGGQDRTANPVLHEPIGDTPGNAVDVN